MLSDGAYRRAMLKRAVLAWLRRLGLAFGGLLFFFALILAVQNGSSKQLISLLSEQRFPFEAFLLEGAPGYSQPARSQLDGVRQQGIKLGMFLLTGVNISDARTFFLSYFTPPAQGPAWIGWAYNPQDPEYEGPIAEQGADNGPAGNPDNSGNPDSSGNPDNSGNPAGAGQGSPEAPPIVPLQPGTVLVGIYNTHNSECYAGDGGPEHKPGKNGDVVTVGETLKQALIKNDIGCVHSTVIHDEPDFMKAYSKSVLTAEKLLKNYPDIRILLDIHRDGLPPGVSKITESIKGKEAAQVLIVIGKQNPHWQKNEELAKELIQLGNAKYPGLFDETISYADDARYNQHLSNGALLLEFGSQLNTLDEANTSAQAVAEILSAWFKQQGYK